MVLTVLNNVTDSYSWSVQSSLDPHNNIIIVLKRTERESSAALVGIFSDSVVRQLNEHNSEVIVAQ